MYARHNPSRKGSSYMGGNGNGSSRRCASSFVKALFLIIVTISAIYALIRVYPVQQRPDVAIELESATSKRFSDSEMFERYLIWRHAFENKNSDANVRLIRENMITAGIYSDVAELKGKSDLHQVLEKHLEACQHVLGEAKIDADLDSSAQQKIEAIGHVLQKAKKEVHDCEYVRERLRLMLESADQNVRSLKKQHSFLSQLAAKTIPNSIHCLSMHLTIDYNLLSPEDRMFPKSDKLEDPSLYHYALFSDNVLAASVVVNSAVTNAKEPEKHVFHLVTNKLNHAAMSMWFLLNPPGKATIHVDNVDEFHWLNASYCPVLQQLESAKMKQFYFHQTLLAASSNLKFQNPKYLSMLNHLRFYLPEVYPKLNKILFLDDDIVVQKDLTGLWEVDLKGNVIGAVETCGESFHRFDKYLNFSNPLIKENFSPTACGWAYGMNMFDLQQWKKKNITGIYHKWQSLNENRTLWKLGTLPPGLITFYGLVQPLDKSWHVLGLGYKPVLNSKEMENAAVIHYNGNMKPWLDIAFRSYTPYWTKYVNYDHPYFRKCDLTQ